MTEYIKLALDILILAGLGGFMYYALRLSKALDVFRTYRGDFQHVMTQLTTHIDEAQKAIEELKDVSASSGADLRKMVKDAQFLCDDLEFMTETGNNLAERLESASGKGGAKNVSDLAQHRTNKAAQSEAEDDGFMIQDREIDDIEDEDIGEFSSEAEKELYKALKNAEGKI